MVVMNLVLVVAINFAICVQQDEQRGSLFSYLIALLSSFFFSSTIGFWVKYFFSSLPG